MQRFVHALLVAAVISSPQNLSAGSSDASRERYVALQHLRAEIYFTSSIHSNFAFEPYRQATFNYMGFFPHLLVEEAYCIVSNDQSARCAEVVKFVPAEGRSAIPPGSLPVMKDDGDGQFSLKVDTRTGLPVFSRGDGPEYTAFGVVGQTTKRERNTEKHKEIEQSTSPFVGGSLLGPINSNAYGPGLHSDATGRPFTFRTKDGQNVQGPVKTDAYGPGVHQDQFGRPVFAVPR